MKKILFLLGVGAAVGYFAGFSDARQHDQNVVERWIARVGKAQTARAPNDVDAAMERLEKK
jgi:hypothetical protein